MLMERIWDFSFSVSPSIAWMSSNLFLYLRWSKKILQSELLMILSLTTGDWMMSSTSCVTTIASPKNLRTVLKRYLMYSAIPSLAMALSGRSAGLLPLSPLRTVRESFPSYGSSNLKFLFRNQLIVTSILIGDNSCGIHHGRGNSSSDHFP